MSDEKEIKATFLGFVLITLVIAAFNGLFWHYAINAIITYQHKSAHLPFYAACVIGMVPWVGKFGAAVAALTWLAVNFLL